LHFCTSKAGSKAGKRVTVDSVYQGKKILLTLLTPDAPTWMLDIVAYRGLTRAVVTAYPVPPLAGASAAGTVNASYSILELASCVSCPGELSAAQIS
jgi:hypothetical protein